MSLEEALIAMSEKDPDAFLKFTTMTHSQRVAALVDIFFEAHPELTRLTPEEKAARALVLPDGVRP